MLQTIAALMVGLLVLRTGVAALHHFFPDSAATAAAQFIAG